MGFDEKQLEELPTDTQSYWSTEAQVRRSRDDELGTSLDNTQDPAARPVVAVEGYYRVDMDGDGIPELRQIWTGPNGHPILLRKGQTEPDVCNGPTAPFASLTPVPIPHRFFGLSEADLVMDLQLIKSTLARQLLDNLYHLNNQRLVVTMASEDGVNLDDLLTNRPGGIIRTRPGSAVVPIANEPIGGVVLPALEYLDTVKENRSGVTRYNQGLDANSLNKTATGVTQIMTASQERQLLVARIFAETGVKDLCRGLLQLECEHRTQPRMIRLRNKWVDIDPREWATLTDVTIDVALGTGNKDAELQKRLMLLNVQKEFAMQGLTNIVGPQQLYNNLAKIVTLVGDKTPDAMAQDPHGQMPPAKPDPKMAQVQGQLQLQQAKLQGQMQMDQAKIAGQMQLQQMQMRMQAMNDEMIAQREAVNDMRKAWIAAMAGIEEARIKALVDGGVSAYEISMKNAAGAYDPAPASEGAAQ
jgi:hypothetical protein